MVGVCVILKETRFSIVRSPPERAVTDYQTAPAPKYVDLGEAGRDNGRKDFGAQQPGI
jgi:hypothetical protein